jgi:hypothetical protein
LYVLLHGPGANASEVFKLALQELAGRDGIALGTFQQGSGRTTTWTAVVVALPASPGDLARSLRSVLDAHASLPAQTPVDRGTGVTVPELARALRARHGGTLSQWVTDEVMPTLVERGLYTEEQVTRLGLLSSTRYEPTNEGNAARALLEASLKRTAEQFPDWAANDRARAGAFLATAGSGILLIPELRPAIEELYTASPGAKKMMAAGAETLTSVPEPSFDIFRLAEAGTALKTLDLNVDYGQLDRDHPAAEE